MLILYRVSAMYFSFGPWSWYMPFPALDVYLGSCSLATNKKRNPTLGSKKYACTSFNEASIWDLSC